MGEPIGKGAQNYVGVILLVQNNTLAWCLHWHGYFSVAWITHPAWLLEALPCNFRILSMVCLLPSHHGKENLCFGAFGCL